MAYTEPHGRGWRVRYRHAGRLHSLPDVFPTKTAAERARRLLEADLLRGEHVDPRGGEVLLADWAEDWLSARPGLKRRTADTDASRMRRHIVPLLGHFTLREVDAHEIRRWLAALVESGLAPKTVRNCHGLLHALLDGAVELGMVRRNPCKDTGKDLPENTPAEMVFLTEQQFARLAAATPEHYRPLVVTLAGTGLRWGEATGLAAGRVDVLGGHLTVVETLHLPDSGPPQIGTPKSRRSRRRVSLPLHVREALVPVVAGKGSSELVFTTEAGAPIRRQNFARRVWAPALAEAGIWAEEKDPATKTVRVTVAETHVRPRVHDLRHTHASWLIADNVPLPAISRRLGHASISITVDVYGHLLPEVDDALLAALDRRLSEGAAPNLLPLASLTTAQATR